jgi:hypothetical protein
MCGLCNVWVCAYVPVLHVAFVMCRFVYVCVA